MDAELKDGLQQAFAQFVAWLTFDHDGAKALHDQAAEDSQTWALNRALLFMAQKGWRAYFHATGRTDADMIEALRHDIANLAAMEGDP